MKAEAMLGRRSAGAAAAPREAQNLDRHTDRAAASHLSPAELKIHESRTVARDAAAYDRMRASKPLKPPRRRP